jgi:hypothetical protein
MHERTAWAAQPSRGEVECNEANAMVPSKYLLDHIEALLRISHDIKDPATSAKLREMADELRILISVADVADLAATFGNPPAAAAPVANDLVTALYGAKTKRKRKAKETSPDAASSKPKRRAKKHAEGG